MMRSFDFVGDEELAQIIPMLHAKDNIIRLFYGGEPTVGDAWDPVSYVVCNETLVFCSSKNANPPSGVSAFFMDKENCFIKIEEVEDALKTMRFLLIAEGRDMDVFLADCTLLDNIRPTASCSWFFHKYKDTLQHALVMACGL
jgi:hypothetical protein